LTRAEIMALATLDDDGGSWISLVQFQYDAGLHLYFASLPDARHVATSSVTRAYRQRSTAIQARPVATSGSGSKALPNPFLPRLVRSQTAGSTSRSHRTGPGSSTRARTDSGTGSICMA
jgi:hypothetical protein